VTELVEERLRQALGIWRAHDLPGDPQAPVKPDSSLTGARALELFDAQLTSRHLDLAARWLRSFGEGYYTIGSSGHEGNAAIAAALRPTDPALLHYRSGAFYCARAAQLAESKVDPIRDVLRGMMAAVTDPISGGRHKVFGHPDRPFEVLNVDRPIEPELRPELVGILAVVVFLQEHRHRVAGQHPDQQEDDDAHPDQGRDDQQQSSSEIDLHRHPPGG
jgi:hypothetical protein